MFWIIAQIVLLVLWFTVPVFMALPWFVIFIPLIILAVIYVFLAILALVGLVLMGAASKTGWR